MELLLDSVYYLYNYYMVCAPLFYTYHITPLYRLGLGLGLGVRLGLGLG